VLDSDRETWVWTGQSGGAGFTQANGFWFNPVGTLDVDAQGGEGNIGTLGFSIPAGTFSQGVTLKGSASDALVAGSGAEGFLLSGLPKEHGAFTISLPLSEDEAVPDHVVLADESYLPSAHRLAFEELYLPAHAEGDRLTFEVPPAANDTAEKVGKAVSSGRWVYLHIPVLNYEGVKYVTGSGRFAIWGSTLEILLNQSAVESLGAELDLAYSKLVPSWVDGPAQGIGMLFRHRGTWPISVHVSYWWFTDPADGYANHYTLGGTTNFDSLSFDLFKISKPERAANVRATATHELFHLLQYNYAPRKEMAGPEGWLGDACATWSEWLTGAADYYPDNIAPNEGLFPLNGLLDPASTMAVNEGQVRSPASHGYVASLFVRRMLELHGMNAMGRLWESIGSGSDIPAAFSEAVSADWTLTWKRFCEELYGGSLWEWSSGNLHFNRFSSKLAAVNPSSVWQVDTIEEAVGGHEFTVNFPPVSGSMLQIPITVDLSGRAGMTVLNIDPQFSAPLCGIHASLYMPRTAPGQRNDSITLADLIPEGPGKTVKVDLKSNIDLWVLQPPCTATLVLTSRDLIQNLAGQKIKCWFGPYPTLEQLHQTTLVSVAINGTAMDNRGRQQPQLFTAGGAEELKWDDRSFKSKYEKSIPNECSPFWAEGTAEGRISRDISGRLSILRDAVESFTGTFVYSFTSSCVNQGIRTDNNSTDTWTISMQNVPFEEGMAYSYANGPANVLAGYKWEHTSRITQRVAESGELLSSVDDNFTVTVDGITSLSSVALDFSRP